MFAAFENEAAVAHKQTKKGIFKGVARAIVVLVRRMPAPIARFFHEDS